MRKLSIFILVLAVIGALLGELGVFYIMPRTNWLIVLGVAAVFAYFMRQPGD